VREFRGGFAKYGGGAAFRGPDHYPKEGTMSRPRLAVSTYSYWHFRGPKTPIETVIDRAAALGARGVDILHQQMESEEPAYLQRLKRHAFTNGVDLVCLSIHQNFVSPDPTSGGRTSTTRCAASSWPTGWASRASG
jgi:hypothetical protein